MGGSGHVDFIVHGPPGSAPPVLAEAFCAAISERGLDPWPWVLRSHGGDPGIDAMRALALRPGDPDVLSTCTPVFLQAPLLRGTRPTHRDLTPLARLVADRYLVVARADAPWRGPADFLNALRDFTTRTGGYFKGGINHLLALSIAEAVGANVEFTVVASEPAVWAELAGGNLDWGCGVAAEVLPHIEAGRLRPLATLDTQRLPGFPAVPTLAEFGVPITFKLWRGLIGPPSLTEADQARWHALAGAVRGTKAWSDYLSRNSQSDDFLAGEAFKSFLDTEWDWYAHHLGRAGLLPPPGPKV